MPRDSGFRNVCKLGGATTIFSPFLSMQCHGKKWTLGLMLIFAIAGGVAALTIPGPLGRVNGQILDRDEIWTPNFQLLYLFQLYSKNLTIVLEPFTGTL